MATDRLQITQDLYRAFAAGDRSVVERTFTDDFSFSSPLDVGLDRDGYFERCWPKSGDHQDFDFVRLVESGTVVVVTYEVEHRDGRRGRNTEVLTFRGEQVCATEVYFGWDVL